MVFNCVLLIWRVLSVTMLMLFIPTMNLSVALLLMSEFNQYHDIHSTASTSKSLSFYFQCTVYRAAFRIVASLSQSHQTIGCQIQPTNLTPIVFLMQTSTSQRFCFANNFWSIRCPMNVLSTNIHNIIWLWRKFETVVLQESYFHIHTFQFLSSFALEQGIVFYMQYK